MKIGKKALLFQIFMVQACAMFSSESTVSEWETLKGAQKVKCNPWPKREQDLDVSELVAVGEGEKKSLLARGRTRAVKPYHAYASFSGETEIGRGSIKDLRIEGQAHFLDVANLGGRHLAVFNLQQDEKSFFLIKDLNTGKTLHKIPHKLGFLEEVQIATAKAGLWLSYRTTHEDASIEDSPTQLVYLLWGDKPVIKPVKDFSAQGRINLIALGKNASKVAAVWLDTGTSSNMRKPSFRARVVQGDKVTGQEIPLKLPFGSEVENWSAAWNGSGILISYVDGDTLMGDANLRVALFEPATGAIKWVETKSLLHEHAAKPLWVNGKDGETVLLLPKWLDAEVTLTAYKISKSDVASLGAFGVFKQGTVLKSAFFDPESQQIVSIVTYKKGRLSEFALCQLPPI